MPWIHHANYPDADAREVWRRVAAREPITRMAQAFDVSIKEMRTRLEALGL